MMKVIAKIIDMIQDELDGAEEYALSAMKWKKDYPKLSEKLHELASVEMQHSRILHDEVTRLIDSYRAEHGEPPSDMLAIYNYEHEKSIKKAAEIKSMIEEFNR